MSEVAPLRVWLMTFVICTLIALALALAFLLLDDPLSYLAAAPGAGSWPGAAPAGVQAPGGASPRALLDVAAA